MGKKWEKKPDVRYFTFPVQLLRGAFDDISGVCRDAIYYAVYVASLQFNSGSKALDFFGYPNDPDFYKAIVERGRVLRDSFGDKPPLVSVNAEIIIDFIGNPKTDFQIAVFCAFCGVRSIIGKKASSKSNNGLLIARMFGYATEKEFNQANIKPAFHTAFLSTPQQIRYHLTEKIIRGDLCFAWGLRYYANGSRGFHLSFDLSFETLVTQVEKERKSTLLKVKKERENEIIRNVKQQLKSK